MAKRSLFEQLGGREWVREIGAKVEGAVSDHEIKLLLPAGKGPNRATVASKKAGVVKVSLGLVAADGEGEDLGTHEVETGEEAARLIEQHMGLKRPVGGSE